MESRALNTIEDLSFPNKFAVGNDLVYLPEFKQSLNPSFIKKVYTDQEVAYCERFDNSLLRYASTWAAKEAVYKAVKQIDQTALSWKNIEIYREKIAGKPSVVIQNALVKYPVSLSISHDGDYAWAIAIIDKMAQVI